MPPSTAMARMPTSTVRHIATSKATAPWRRWLESGERRAESREPAGSQFCLSALSWLSALCSLHSAVFRIMGIPSQFVICMEDVLVKVRGPIKYNSGNHWYEMVTVTELPGQLSGLLGRLITGGQPT